MAAKRGASAHGATRTAYVTTSPVTAPTASMWSSNRSRPCEFEGHPIPALGIGSARRRDQVLAAVRRFLPEADFECGEGGEDQTETCNATLDPGWVTIKFDASGSLIEVRLDGYHFT